MNESHFFEREFEIRFLKCRGAAFQDFFADLMERAYPADFQRIRPHGNTGDFKCDGYLNSRRAVYQVYGPDEIRTLSRLLQKVRTDYRGARRHWAGRMDQWVFVHNSPTGLPAQAVQLLDDYKKEPGSPDIITWGQQKLGAVLRVIPMERLRVLFQSPFPTSSPAVADELPGQVEVRNYLAWAGTQFQDQAQPRHLSVLQRLALPSRLITPEEAHERRLREEREAGTHSRPPGDLAGAASGREGGERQWKRSIDLIYALRQHRRVLILGESGSGKSTLLRRFVKRQADRKHARGFVRGSGRTPILVELWRFSRERPLLDLIASSVGRSGAKVTREQLVEALKRGYVALFLDGLDEVSAEHRRECLAQILNCIEMAPRTWVVVTSRPFPEPPDYFYQLELAALADEDIAAALGAYFGSGGAFRKRFPHYLPEDYVSALRPQVKQLCRRPLTFAFILNLLATDGQLPETLFGVYNRILAWLLDWERSRGRLTSVAAAEAALEEASYAMRSRDKLSLTTGDWLQAAGRAIQAVRRDSVSLDASAEQLLELFLSAGLLINSGGEVLFSHRSLLDFLAAKRLSRNPDQVHLDPVALNVGVGVFLCGALACATLLFEEYYRGCNNIESMRHLLKEAEKAGCEIGRFEGVSAAIASAEEGLAVDLSYSMRGTDEEEFTQLVELIVNTCVAFKPTMLTALKNAADGVVRAEQWENSRRWFELLTAGLVEYGWPGAAMHKRLSDAGLFERMDVFSDDGTDPHAAERCEDLFDYLTAAYEDNFERAAELLIRLETHLSSRGSD